MNLSTTTILGTEESGRCRVRFKQESMHGLSAKRMYNTRIEIWTTLYRSLIATSVDYCIMLLVLISPLLCKRQRKEARPSRGVPSYSLKFYFCSTVYQTSVHLCRPLIGHVRGESKPERPNIPQQLFQRLPVAPSSINRL